MATGAVGLAPYPLSCRPFRTFNFSQEGGAGSLIHFATPEMGAAKLNVHGYVVGEEEAGAKALGETDAGAVGGGSEEGDVAKADVALEGTGHPGADAALAGFADPFEGTGHAAVEGGLDDDVLRAEVVEEFLLVGKTIDADEFLVEGDGYGALAAETRGVVPEILAHGLLDGMDAERSEFAEAGEGLVGGEGAVGVEAYLERVGREAGTEEGDEAEFVVPIEGANLELDAAEAGEDFLLGLLEHSVVGVHPYEAVGGDAFLAAGEGRLIEEGRLAQVVEGGLEGEEEGRISPQAFQPAPQPLPVRAGCATLPPLPC